MNKTVLKDIFREITSNKGRFFSIMALLMISMVAFSGVFMATILLDEIPELYYNKYNFYDATITSTLGLSSSDEVLIGTNLKVNQYEMIKSVDLFIENTSDIIRVESLPLNINKLILVEGRMPEKNNEIVLGYDFFKENEILGKTISFVNSRNSTNIKELKFNEFKVVGLIRTLDQFTMDARDISTIGSGVISALAYIQEGVFDVDYYTKARVTGVGLSELDSSDDEYERLVQELLFDLELTFKDRPKTRVIEVRQEVDQEISKAEAKIADAKKEIEDARNELEEGKIELLEAELDLKEGELSLIEAREDIKNGWRQYEDGKITLMEEETKARKDIADGKIKLQDAKVELDKGRVELIDGRRKYEEGLRDLEDAKKKFAEGEKKFNDGLKEYEDGKKDLEDMKEKIRISKEIRLGQINQIKNKEELESNIKKLSLGIEGHQSNLGNYKAQLDYNRELPKTTEDKEQINEKISELENLVSREEIELERKSQELVLYKKQLADFEKVEKEGRLSDEVLDYSDESIEAAEKQLKDAKIQIDEARIELEEGRKELQDGIKKIEDARIELEKGEKDFAEGEAEYKKGLADIKEAEITLEREMAKGRQELIDAKNKLEEGEKDYQQGIIDLREGKQKYQDGLKEYREGLLEFRDGEMEFEEKSAEALEEIADAKEEVLKLKEAKFIIDSRNANSSYYTVQGFPTSLRILAIVLSLLALLIALLVAFTTMTRMVDERRILIGTYKGLGYNNNIISAKFILFGGISGIVGTILGTFIGQKLVGPLIYKIYMDGLIFEEVPSMFSNTLFVIGIILAILTTSFSAYLSANKTLKENTASLLRPKAPKAGSRIFLERIGLIWNRLGFMNKITARNIFRYKGRMSMTIIGVAGCMAILILGFGMKFSIQSVSRLQFEEIQNYNIMFSLEEGLNEKELENVFESISNNDNVEKYALTNSKQLVLQISGKGTQDVTLLVDLDGKLSELNQFRERKSKKLLELNDNGVLLTEKLAVLLNVDIGDTFEIEINDEFVQMQVEGITEQYIGHMIYCKADYIKKLTTEKLEGNLALVELKEKGEEAEDKTAEEILKNKYILSLMSSKIAKASLNDTIDSIDSVIYIIVIIAMLLSLVVLYNLTNINVSERIRELSTMKVLGFYPKELTEYVYKETFFLSLIGILLGMLLGKLIVDFVIEAFAPTNVMFGYPNYPLAYAISIAMTLVFTLIVMVMMHVKLKNIDMIEALKSVD